MVFTVLLPPAVPPPGLFLNVHSIQQVPFNVQVSERRVNLNLKHLLILCSRGPEGGLPIFELAFPLDYHCLLPLSEKVNVELK